MKCNKCNNEATFFYSENINGNITETALCRDCADSEGLSARINEQFGRFRDTMNPFGSMGLFGGGFDSFFDRPLRSLMGGGFFDDMFPSGGFFQTPRLSSPTAVIEDRPVSAPAPAAGNVTETDAELSRKREINALRAQMQEAAKAEDFETAIKLRDQLKGMEG